MPDYRLFTIHSGNLFAGPPVILQCASDEEAVTEAKKLLDGNDMEVWHGGRVVIRLRPDDK